MNPGAYINTGIPETALFSAEYKAVNQDWTPPKGHVLSSLNTFYSFLKGSYNEGEQLLVSNFRGSAPADVTIAVGESSPYVIRNTLQEGSMAVSLNGNPLYTAPVGTTASAGNPFYLFAYGGNAAADRYWFTGRFYYLKLWEQNGILAHHLIPVKRSDGVIGLYDKVTGDFHTSATGVAFGGA